MAITIIKAFLGGNWSRLLVFVVTDTSQHAALRHATWERGEKELTALDHELQQKISCLDNTDFLIVSNGISAKENFPDH